MLFCFILIVPIIPFISYSDSLSYLTIFVISSISSFEIINAIVADPKKFFWTAVFVGDIAADNPIGNNTFLANAVSALFPLMVNEL